jgi:hypothetical protein
VLKQIIIAMLVELHAADGTAITINPHGVISMRGPREGDARSLFTGDAHCLINTSDGKYITTRETCAEVMRVFVDADKKEREE